MFVAPQKKKKKDLLSGRIDFTPIRNAELISSRGIIHSGVVQLTQMWGKFATYYLHVHVIYPF